MYGQSCYATNLKCNWNSESQQWNQEHHQSWCLHKSILTSPDELIQHAPWLQTSMTTSSISNIKSILRATFPRVITKGQSKFQTPLETYKDWVTRPDGLFLYISVDMSGRRMGMQHNDCLPCLLFTPTQGLKERAASISLWCSKTCQVWHLRNLSPAVWRQYTGGRCYGERLCLFLSEWMKQRPSLSWSP